MQKIEEGKVCEAVESIWTTMLGLQATANQTMMAGRLKASNLTGCIYITGAWQGAIKVECSGGLARRVAAIMFGADACDVTPDQINDALGELTNIIGGNTSAPAMMIGERAAEFITQDIRSDTANSNPKLRSVAGGAHA